MKYSKISFRSRLAYYILPAKTVQNLVRIRQHGHGHSIVRGYRTMYYIMNNPPPEDAHAFLHFFTHPRTLVRLRRHRPIPSVPDRWLQLRFAC